MVKQISVFLENKSGRLAEVCEILGKAGINIRALSLADTLDFGILRMMVSDNQKAVRVLKEAKFTVKESEVLVIEVKDKPGGLSDILKVLADTDVNVEYMYAFVEKSGDKALVAFRVEDARKASALLEKKGVKMLSDEEVKRI